jgi:dTDP-4-amino-4,6-dideoxygalactose transaminase
VLTGVHYPTPVHLQPACRWLGMREGDLPATERAAARAPRWPLHRPPCSSYLPRTKSG